MCRANTTAGLASGIDAICRLEEDATLEAIDADIFFAVEFQLICSII